MSVSSADVLDVAMVVEQCWQPVPGGSATYVVELTRALGRRDDVRVTGVRAAHRSPPPADVRPDVPTRAIPLPRAALYEAWQRTTLPRAEWAVRGAQVVHAPTWAVPGTARPLVVTVHDLAFLDDPTHFTPRGNAYFRRALTRTREQAAAVVVPSRATADALLQHGVGIDRVHVVPHGVRVPQVAAAQVAQVRARLGLDRDYLLWAGTLEPRKNVGRLVAAWSDLPAPAPDLVLVGPTGWGDVRVPDTAPPGARVHLTGRLDAADLHALYAGATAFAFPSLREGFGMPVLEAMAHGCPVLTSAGTACAEVAGDAAVLVDPLDVDALAAGLREVLAAGTDLGRRGAAHAAAFTWDASADAHTAVYRQAAAGRRRPRA
ncbi:glycosyltransferase family 4 protein [Cellulomonas sp. S1-8]|uniref:glycosyltransferase family 4 protein n=1 Tax=Cellulomonas sp. S1-8 TaxID=2904790 RepID=UPI002243D7CB|nr:glycosyltransferase family 1 protein [Cellulomonas sp. S1-8]UZN01924.1 glycosyltransferase family 4 protein [Cellulomonas sp. S1-8]